MSHWYTLDSFVKKSIFKNNTCTIDNLNGLLILLGGLLTVGSPSNVTVSECIFLQNIANSVFYASMEGATLTIINCTGDDLTISSNGGSVNTDQMKTDSFNITLSHLSLGECDAENPFSFNRYLFGRKKEETLSCLYNFSLESLYNLTP